MNTLEMNAMRGTLAREILNVEDAELLKKLKRSITRIIGNAKIDKFVSVDSLKSKKEILSRFDEACKDMKLASEGKLHGQSLDEFLNVIHK